MMKVFAVAAASLASATATPFSLCDGIANQLGVDAVTVSPEPVKVGQNVNVQVHGVTSIPFTGGRAEVNVKVAGVKVASLKFDACSELGVACPKNAGEEWTGGLSYPIPKFAPGGITAVIEVNVLDTAGNRLGCASVTEKIVKATGVRGDAAAEPTRAEMEFLFEAWKRQHGIEFGSASEYVARLEVFEANHLRLVQYNAQVDPSKALEHNELSHLTLEELFALQHAGVIMY